MIKKRKDIKARVQYRSRPRKSKRLLTMPPRNRILLEQRERIIRAFEDVHEDYLMVADTTGVNKSTARSIVTRHVREGRIAERLRGGPKHVRVDNEMRDCLDDILNENCLLTLAQINQELRQRLPGKPRIHDRTVARTQMPLSISTLLKQILAQMNEFFLLMNSKRCNITAPTNSNPPSPTPSFPPSARRTPGI